jgi:hypothetical protein
VDYCSLRLFPSPCILHFAICTQHSATVVCSVNDDAVELAIATDHILIHDSMKRLWIVEYQNILLIFTNLQFFKYFSEWFTPHICAGSFYISYFMIVSFQWRKTKADVKTAFMGISQGKLKCTPIKPFQPEVHFPFLLCCMYISIC